MRILYCKYTYYMIKSRRKKKGVFDMATTTNLNIRTDKEIKEAAEYIFNELGISMTTAINMFLRQTIRTNGIPFELKLNTPNEITLAAVEEGRKVALAVYERHSTILSFFSDVLKVSPENAEKDACRVEHVISDETIEAIKRLKK